tara:strand:+ start:194 stop:2623 length:2430 start_codon:yes stop_codon:yes gene_type:complete
MSITHEHIVTIFKNIKETDTPFYRKVESVLKRIKEGASKDLIKKIRAESNKSVRNTIKANLPSICFSGEFLKRSDIGLQKHSGLICLDLDGYPKTKLLLDDKKKFSKNKYVYSVFISPSGKGLKVLVRIPRETKNHVGYFNALEKHFKSEFFDKTSKNISRVCYESYDPLIFINPKAEEWTEVEETNYKEVIRGEGINTIPINEEGKITTNLVTWWTKNYPMAEGSRNQNAFTLAMAFNEYGVSETMATIVLSKYASSDFTASEINKTIKNAYSHRDKYNTKYFEDEERVNDIQQRLRRGESKQDIRQQLSDSMLDDDLIDSVIETAEENNSIKFWTKNSKGIIKMLPLIFKKFLEANGFYKYCPDDQNTYVFVKVTNNLIDNTSEKEIKDFILGHLIELDDMTIYNYFADQTRIFREDFLTLLDTIDIYFIEDTVDTSYLYYQNCAIKITKNEVVPIDYLELNGYVWKNHIIPRDYNKCELGKGDYRTFIANVSDKEPERIKSMESTTGFLLHGYKNISYCPAVILNDEIISDQANGGTGKGIFFQAIDAIKKVATIDGKAFNFEKSFPYQTVSADTQIILFDDVKQGFQFDRLFSVVTEGLTLEKKNKDAIKIPFYKSPKISITTNHIIKGTGNSFIRRKWELELTQYYTEIQTPLEEFGRYLFGGWDQDEWCQFDNYMIYCLQLYLRRGLIKSVLKNQKIKLFQADTDEIFTEWCGLLGEQHNPLLKTNEKIYTNFLYGDFVTMNPDYGQFGKRKLSRTEFNKWLKSYSMYTQGVEPKIDRDSIGKFIIIKVKPTKKEAEQETLEF